MIFTTTTIKDATESIEAFVRRNLCAGVDHMLLFIEGGDADAQAKRFQSHAHVTAIPTTDAYWQGRRPDDLNHRQVANANLANNLLAGLPWADWLFHIDGDEVVHIDPAVLGRLPRTVHAVRLSPLEATAQDRYDGPVTHFKRVLPKRKLNELHDRGLIPAPDNAVYFRGHTAGKAGIRPSPFITPRVHRAKTHNNAVLEHREHPRLSLLHYESFTGAEFIRKWTNLVAGANVATFRANRKLIANEVAGILHGGDSEAEKQARMWDVFARYGRDDVAALDSLGVLVTPDLGRSYTPTAMDREQVAVLREVLALFVDADKRYFAPQRRNHPPIDLLRQLAGKYRRKRPDLAGRLEYAITR